MLRAILIYLSKAVWARRLVTSWRFARRAASRFVAGDTLEEAIQTIQELKDKGRLITLDHLGEHVSTAEEAQQAADVYIDLLDQLKKNDVESSISLKLTALGLGVGFDLCRENMVRIMKRAAELDNFVRIDMEDSPVIDQTLTMYHALRESGFDNVGMVIQSYLYRSEADTRNLLEEGTRIRLVKGAYDEPPDLAFPRKSDVDENFDLLTKMIIDSVVANGKEIQLAASRLPPVAAIATHDDTRIEFACQYAEKVGLPRHALEFQMLYGIRNNLQKSLTEEGYPVRVYVPYGTEWYPYYVRRLAERPANLWFFLSNFFRR